MFSFIETRLFTKLVLDCMTDEEYAALQSALMNDPESGPLIQVQAAFANFAGQHRGEASEAVTV